MTNLHLEPVVEVKLNDLICERLKDYIVHNSLVPGDRLPTEESLAQSLGVSRTALREGLRSLESLGIIEARRGVGRVVRDFNFDAILGNLLYALSFQNESVQNITDIRRALEFYYVEAAIRHLSEEDLQHIAALIERMDHRLAEGLNADDEDHAIHRLLLERGGNSLSVQWLEIAWQVKNNAFRLHHLQQTDDPVGEHTAILDALRRRDVAAARAAVMAHYDSLDRRLQSSAPQSAPRDKAGDY
jgi:DNA-binding FadR family transcriptional regulator